MRAEFLMARFYVSCEGTFLAKGGSAAWNKATKRFGRLLVDLGRCEM